MSKQAGGQMHADVASVLNRLDQARTATVIRRLQEVRPADAKTVERMLFRFDDLLSLPPAVPRNCRRRNPVEQLVLALAGTSPEFQTEFFPSCQHEPEEWQSPNSSLHQAQLEGDRRRPSVRC